MLNGLMPHHTTASVHRLGQRDKSYSLLLAATILTKQAKHSNSQGPEHPHSKYLYLPLNQHNGSWMGSGSIFALINFSPFYPQLPPPPPPTSSTQRKNQGFYPLPAKPQCLERPQENEKATSNKLEDRTECL